MSISRRSDRTPPFHSHDSHSDSSPSPTTNSTTSHQSQNATSPPVTSMDDDGPTATPPQVDPTSRPPSSRSKPSSFHVPSFPAREDCWSEEATYTLVEAWGERFLELNRGNLRQAHWQEVAGAVNARHGHIKKARRTDIQCKNRIDTLKKKFKIEKARVLESDGEYTSPWPFFTRLDLLIGDSYKPSPPVVTPRRKTPPTPRLPALPPIPSSVPVGPRSKRPAPAENLVFRRNFSTVAAVEAEEESDTSRSSAVSRRGEREGLEVYRELAEAIGRFGEIYERVEEAKQRQMIELEKQRMQFAKDLEIQRMKLFMESQVQLQKIKRSKRNSEDDSYL